MGQQQLAWRIRVVLGDRFTVKVEGEADSIDELKAALDELDLARSKR